MSLDLTKYREANHERIAVGGSYTDTWLEVMGISSTSSNTFGYVRWIPNNKSGSGYYTGTVYNSTFGYNQYTLKLGETDPWVLFRFSYHDDTNTYNGGSTSPGIRLQSVTSYAGTGQGANNLAAELTSIHQDNYGDVIYVLVNNGSVTSSSNLKSIMDSGNKSWRWSPLRGTSTSATNHTYAAIGTNINNIGYLAESIAGTGLNHSAAMTELVIEHKKNTIGHAGYGEDLASGLGNGSAYIDLGSYSTAQTFTRTINWASSNKHHTSPDEYVRVTWDQRIGQGGRTWGASCRVTVREEKISNGATIGAILQTSPNSGSQTVDGWHKQELLFARQSSSSDTRLDVEIRAYKGSGTGTGVAQDQGFHRIDVKNMQVFKCGFAPDQQRDAATHKYHVNGLNIEESPGPFRIGAPSEFKAFWNSDRNLAGNSTTYTLETTNSSTSTNPMRPINYQSRNGSNLNWGDPQGYYNYPHWFEDLINPSTSNSQTWGWVHEVYNATVNDTYDKYLGPASGIAVDHTKVYMAGIWMRVRRNSHTNSTLAPNRISMVAGTQNPGAFISSFGTGTNLLAAGTNYQQSIYAGNFDFVDYTPGSNPGKMEWKLLSGFYLPSWMTSTERTTWKDDYWGQWAGHFEHGDGGNPDENMSGITGYGLNTANAGYVAGMQSSTTSIRPLIRVEQYQSTDLWCEFVYPFVIEIDPMNINDEGNIYFWDFTENLPA